MTSEHADLYFQQGGSDKVYHVQLTEDTVGWSVAAQWGRRGAALQNAVKTSGATYAATKRVYDQLVKEKLAKGYQLSEGSKDAALSVGAPTKTVSGHVPELLTPMDESDALVFVSDAAWWFQQKFDGRRLAVQKLDGVFSGINKLGQVVSLDASLSAALGRVRADAFLVDGEITGARFDVWDLLTLDRTDLRGDPYAARYEALVTRFGKVDPVIQVAETAQTAAAKKRFVDAMRRANAEGFVCKNRSAASAAGRAGQHFKVKFVATASLIVGPKPRTKAADGHRSIGLYLLDGARERFMGTVGVPERYDLPTTGQIVEVRYLYCHPGPEGKLIQPHFFGVVRDDVARTECSVDQLKLKADSEAREAP